MRKQQLKESARNTRGTLSPEQSRRLDQAAPLCIFLLLPWTLPQGKQASDKITIFIFAKSILSVRLYVDCRVFGGLFSKS